ncbi:TonB-dependent receptor [Pedobacter sp. SD-b]|uniref:TonB-dependent receptor n=1 Tax=Pedobacter segetis TaxID=2793069 RepID=A0ABS1BM09_9SPHI|nr:carboxypeptidase-like regulatory domain-containing protein [Pedobacter segetis]MBK0383929.1 TonB-dependent receptor [Pedobacter segetis]
MISYNNRIYRLVLKAILIAICGCRFICDFSVRAYCQDVSPEKITINLKNATASEFSKELEKTGRYKIFFDSLIFDSLRVSVAVENKNINDILEKVFTGTKYLYSIDSYGNVFLTKNVVISTNFTVRPNNKTNPESDKNAYQVLTDLNYKASKINSPQDASLENKIYEIGLKSYGSKLGKATISGYVKDAETGQALIGVYLRSQNDKNSTTTNEAGFYSIELATGDNKLIISSVGQKETFRRIKLYSNGKLNIDIKSDAISLKEVVVVQSPKNLQRTQLGIEKITIQSIKQVPTVFGEPDIIKVLLTLPGVKTVGEAAGGFNVRGGATDQNLILFNESTIYNPSHFFGFFSAFNPDLIKDVELYKSSIPAKYGGRLSSVLKVDTREGNERKFGGTAGIGLLTSRLNLEGPIVKDKGSFILGGRSTYSNFIFGLLPNSAGYKNAKASFYDLNLLVDYKLNDKNKVNFTGYLSSDASNLATDTVFQYSNKNASLKWSHIFSQKLNSSFAGGFDDYEYSNKAEKDSVNSYKLAFNIQQTFFKTGFTYYIHPKHTLNFGTNTIYYQLQPGSFIPLDKSSLIIPKILENEQAVENALFLSDDFTLTPDISFDLGLRYSHFTNLGPKLVYNYATGLPIEKNNLVDSTSYRKGEVTQTYKGPEIRFSTRFAITNSLTIKAGYNSMRQYIHLLTNTTAISPTDIWKLSDKNIKPQFGDQVSLGIYKNLKKNTLETSIEIYYKRIKNYLDYKSGAELILNEHIETDVINVNGKAYGIEFFLKKPSGKLNGWFSYTYSRTLFKMDNINAGELINKGNYYPASFDKPNEATLSANYKFSLRFSVSTNITYSTGRPITIPIGSFYYAGSQRALYGDRNSYRIPNYFRTDLSINIDGNHKINQFAHNSWTIGVYNLTGRDNPYSTFFTSQQGRLNGYQLSIFGSAVPFINYNLRF